MFFLYNIIIHFYHAFIRIGTLFSSKARLWVNGRKGLFEHLQEVLEPGQRTIWFHAASLGEFEQGRPVIEAFREKYPEHQILLTFFSPSGYEIRKDYPGADHVFYLPIDTVKNAKRFVELVNPEIALFIKYEFWFNYLDQLYKNNIPVYVISAIFRPDQHFFRPWGSWFRNQLKKVSLFFVQDQASADLLKSIGIHNLVVSGDTRFDRVQQIAGQKKAFPIIQKFTEDHPVLLAGSSWPPDESLLLSLLQEGPDFRVIIAPHEVNKDRIMGLVEQFRDFHPIRYSQADENLPAPCRVLIIDGMGFLSSLYQYCTIAFIGGGFGKGIHNILEAVTFGRPVVFGPNYKKFAEARNLLAKGGAFEIDPPHFSEHVRSLVHDQEAYNSASVACHEFIRENAGATARILQHIRLD